MAEIGNGYGSECHLLRYLGRHRHHLDDAVLRPTGAQRIEWLDFPFDCSRKWNDGEWKGLDFLPEGNPARLAWKEVWPQRGNVPNWDAVGVLERNGVHEWLLVEAKANLEELRSSCQASASGGRSLIERTLKTIKDRLGVAPDCDWLNGYYQYCNRIAVLSLLAEHGVPARMLYIYFVGDKGDQQRTCPADAAGWNTTLASLKVRVGLPSGYPLEERMHEVFLHVCPTGLEPNWRKT